MTLITEALASYPSAATFTRAGAVFIDRDGVINENRADHVKCWSEFRFLPGAPEAIGRLTQAGLRVFVVTNQAIVNRGMVSRSTVDELNQAMIREISRHGGRVEAVACCPHRPDEQCGCRKPRPGLLLNLARKFELDLRSSTIVGDALSDLQAGRAVGSRAILVLTGRGREQLAQAAAVGTGGFTVVEDLAAAADLLVDVGQASAGCYAH
jgi:D-glycero-D-manno-heptose 1,7-bisphosphate phosphatase